MKVAVLTPLSLEREAVLAHLADVREEVLHGELYYRGTFTGAQHSYEVTVKETGSGNTAAGLAAEKIIAAAQPQLLFLTGIAGGVKDVEVGDIVIGTQAHGYESGKETSEGFRARPKSYWCNKSLLNLAKIVHSQNVWHRRRKPPGKNARVFFGPIASGEKVITATDALAFQQLKLHYNDTLALEMEAHGVGCALHGHAHVHWLNVRGISDLCTGKNAAEDLLRQPYAAAQGAAFLFEMLYKLNAKELNLPIMTAKDLSTAVFNILFPITRLESVKEIGKDLSEATDGTVRELWEKVKPYLIEEVEELEKSPQDTDSQADVRNKMKKVFGKEEHAGLKAEVEEKVEKIAAAAGKEVSVFVKENSGTVIGKVEGQNITQHFGDIINIQQTQKEAVSEPQKINTEKTELIHDLIKRSKIKPALEELLKISKAADEDLHEQILQQSARWNSLTKDERLGIISRSDAEVVRGRIVYALLGIVRELGGE